MSKSVEIAIDTRTLARAMSAIGGEDFATIEAWNAGTYPGTKTKLRKMTGDEIVVVRISEGGGSAKILDTDGGWIAERFGSLGARQVRALVALAKDKR